MDLAEYVRCGTLAHGHVCPPLVLGVRAGFVAMSRLGVGRAVERELFAFVELGSDHYAQGFDRLVSRLRVDRQLRERLLRARRTGLG